MKSSDDNLISLKEAAEVSGYSPDYIGQLIRSGKIVGKQVYTNIAWMTTAEAVLDYKNKGNKKNKGSKKNNNFFDYFLNKSRVLKMELDILKLFFKTFKSAFPILVLIVVSFLLLNLGIIFYFTENKSQVKIISPEQSLPQISY